MNITAFHIGNHVSNQGKSGSVFAGNLPMMQRATLKSTRDKLERQQNTQNQVAYMEKQKENLKNMECGSLEEIAKKLELFHTYESEIAAVKMKYNNEQMMHVMDESRELGERIAKEAEKFKPKTAEERRKEMVEEALGIDDSKGELTESMEEIQEEIEEAAERVAEELVEQTPSDEMSAQEQINAELKQEALEDQPVRYKGIDLFI